MTTQLSQQHLAEFERVVDAILGADNAARTAGERWMGELKQRDPSAFLLCLLTLLQSSNQAQSRQFAAIILRQNLLVNSSSPAWKQSGADTKKRLQDGLLQLYCTEPNASLRRKITDCVAATATRISGLTPRFNLATNEKGIITGTQKQKETAPDQQTQWPELMPCMLTVAQNNAPQTKQSTLDLMSRLAEFNPSVLTPHLPACKSIIIGGLKDQSMEVRLSGMQACISLLLALIELDPSHATSNHLQETVPLMFEVLGSAFQQADEETIVHAVGVLDDLASANPKFLKNHLRPIVACMVQMAACQQLEAATRRVCVRFLLTLAEEGKGMVRKVSEFATQVIPLAFGMLQELQHTPEWDDVNAIDVGDDDDGFENYKFGGEAISQLSMSLGGKIFMQVISPILDQALKSSQWNARHAALIAIAKMAKGVDKHLETKLKTIMHTYIVPLALNDPHHRVRWAAVDCVAYLSDAFAEFPDTYTEEVFTILLGCMQPTNHWRIIAHACLCFPDFCRDLDKSKLLQYCDRFLTAAVACLQMSQSPKVVENALGAVSAVAHVCEKDFERYYESFMPGVKGIIMSTAGDERAKHVRARAIECMGMLAQSVGMPKFGPEVESVMGALLNMLRSNLPNDDPQLAHIITSCARICRAVGKEFLPYLPTILPPLFNSARINDACIIVNEGEDNPYKGKAGYVTSEVEVRQTGKQQISINTSLVEEKALAIRMLMEYINTLGGAFFPWLEESVNIFISGSRYQFNENVRTNSILALPAAMRCANEALENDPQRKQQVSTQLFERMFDVQMTGLQVEYDLESLCERLDAFAECVGELCVPLRPDQLDAMTTLIRTLIIDCIERCRARDKAAEEEDFDETESEVMLMENQAEDEFLGFIYSIINKMVKNAKDAFIENYHEKLHPVINAMMSSEDVSLRTSGLCVISQVMEDCPSNRRSIEYCSALHQASLESLEKEVDDVALKQSAAFGLGVCAMVARQDYAQQGQKVVEALVRVARMKPEDTEDDEDVALATDNAVSALAKVFIHTYNSGMPMNGIQQPAPPDVVEVMSHWLEFLPCGGDLIEARKIHDMLISFVATNNPVVLGGVGMINLPHVLRIFASILQRSDWEEVCTADNRQKIIQLFQQMQKQMPEQTIKQLLTPLTVEQQQALAPFIINPAIAQ